MKELINRIYCGLEWLGLADAGVAADTGIIKHKFLSWLYGTDQGTYHPEGCECDDCVNRGFWS